MLTDQVGFDVMPDAVGGEGGHEVAKLEGVAYRCTVNLLPPTTTCRQPLVPRCACLEKGLRHLALDYFYGV